MATRGNPNDKLPHALWGYSPGAADRLIRSMSDEYQDLWRHTVVLRGRLRVAEDQERPAGETMVSAERFARDMRRAAKKHAQLTLRRAEERGRQVVDQTVARHRDLVEACMTLEEEHRRLRTEIQSLRSEARRLGLELTTAADEALAHASEALYSLEDRSSRTGSAMGPGS